MGSLSSTRLPLISFLHNEASAGPEDAMTVSSAISLFGRAPNSCGRLRKYTRQMQALQRKLEASERTVTARIQGTYSVLKREFKLVESRRATLQAYHNAINQHCKHECRGTYGAHQRSDVVKLNVGGAIEIFKKSAISPSKFDVNFLFLMLSGRWDYLLPRDRNGVIFLDLNPALITPVFSNLRYRLSCGSDAIPSIEINGIDGFVDAVLYYNLTGSLCGSTTLSAVSNIECMNDTGNMLVLSSYLSCDLVRGERLKLELLYRGSRDGATTVAFHHKCYGRCNTLSVIKDKQGNVFGGFADLAWSRADISIKSEKSFLFSLKTSMQGRALKFPVNPKSQASLLHHPDSLLLFGADLQLAVNGYGTVNIGNSYLKPEGMSPYYCINENVAFMATEIEVYQVITEISKRVNHGNRDQAVMVLDPMSEPLHSWIVDALVSGGTTCDSFESKLIYRGTRDGFMSTDFHTRCDGALNTVCVMKDDDGNIMGGFADAPWSSSEIQVMIKSANSFVFNFGKSGTSKHLKMKSSFMTHSSIFLCAFEGLFLANNGSLNYSMHENIDDKSNTFDCKVAVEVEVYSINPTTMLSVRSADGAKSKSKVTFDIYVTQTDELASQLLENARMAQLEEEELLLELLWIEHLSVPMNKKDCGSGLRAEWLAKRKAAADVLPLSNGVHMTSYDTETLQRIKESMERLCITIEVKTSKDDDPQNSKKPKYAKTYQIRNVIDEVISFNVGGTIIAVLRSTLLLQAPMSTLAVNFSNCNMSQPVELDEYGNIYMVRESDFSQSILSSCITFLLTLNRT